MNQESSATFSGENCGMSDRLFVAVLGHQNSGKSKTWNDLFNVGHSVRTGSYTRDLELRPGECVEVFLISGSNEERHKYAGDVLANQNAKIILCSVQYVDECRKTFEYVRDNEFDLFVQWLNPGYSDPPVAYFDYLGLVSRLLADRAALSLRDGTVSTVSRVQEIREFIYGWAIYRDLIYPCGGSKSNDPD